MHGIFMFFFLISILAGLYYLIRLIISFIKKDNNIKKYGKYLIACIVVFIASSIGAAKTHEPPPNSTSTISEEATYTIPPPVYLGEMGLNQKYGEIYFKNATQDNGGVAVFGEGEDALYVYYSTLSKTKELYIGGKDIKNAFHLEGIPLATKIYKSSVSEDFPIYILYEAYDMGSDYTIIGRKWDGSFVKLIDTNELTKQYYTNNQPGNFIVYGSSLEGKDNMLVVDCYNYNPRNNEKYPGNKIGQFQFKWNPLTQSFDVEQIKQAPLPPSTASTPNAKQDNSKVMPTKTVSTQKAQSNEIYVGTYGSGLKAYLLADTLKMDSLRDFSVKIKAVDDKGNVVYVDYDFSGSPGEPDTWRNSQGYSGKLYDDKPSVETNIRKYHLEKWSDYVTNYYKSSNRK